MNDEIYMKRCIELAQKGAGFVAPNPMVGSVIVYENKIIGEGYHQKYGEAHAEVNAINSVQNQELLKLSTLFVNLEPCAHFGKTPPCANLIVEKKIPRVVIGCIDTFSAVAGKGIEHLEKNGVHVFKNVLQQESRALNKRFFTFHEKQRPYVILKWAQSCDGFIDIDRTNKKHGIFWISEENTKLKTHQWRHEESAILVGWKTIANDNPELTCRSFQGKNPIRIIIDKNLVLDYNAFKVGDRKAKTIILTEKTAIGDENLQFIHPKSFSIQDILATLFELSIQSLIIEGGKYTLDQFIVSNLWDEARVLSGKIKLTNGVNAPLLNRQKNNEAYFGNDLISYYLND